MHVQDTAWYVVLDDEHDVVDKSGKFNGNSFERLRNQVFELRGTHLDHVSILTRALTSRARLYTSAL